jgi:hypothetical protein
LWERCDEIAAHASFSHAASLPALARAAPQAGFFNPLIDADGKVRLNPTETKELLRRLGQLTAHVTRDLLD